MAISCRVSLLIDNIRTEFYPSYIQVAESGPPWDPQRVTAFALDDIDNPLLLFLLSFPLGGSTVVQVGRWRHRIMPPGLRLCEMALVSVTPDDIDVFSLPLTPRSLTNRRAVGPGH